MSLESRMEWCRVGPFFLSSSESEFFDMCDSGSGSDVEDSIFEFAFSLGSQSKLR